jgi:SAM-dependent methyltransferase
MKKAGEDTTALMAEMKTLSDTIKEDGAKLQELDDKQKELMFSIPNLPDEDLLAGGTVEETVGKSVKLREKELARKLGANTAKPEWVRQERLTLGLLKDFMASCATSRTPEGQAAFHTLQLRYNEQVAKIDPLVEEADSKLNNAFDFVEGVWRTGREMLVFLAELTTRDATTQFIAHYGNEKYYAHNDELQVDAHRSALSDRLEELELSKPVEESAEEFVADSLGVGMAGAAGFGGRKRTVAAKEERIDPVKLAAYYSQDFEWGFASMSRMTLPIDKIKGKTVLDVCCRRGKGVYKFSAKIGAEGHVIGVDPSSSYIADAQDGMEKSWRKNGLKKNNMEFAVAFPEDLMEAGIGTGTMDVVYINNVMTLLYDQEAALREFNRVLKPGGLLICETILSDVERDMDVVAKARAMGNSVQAGRTKEELVAWTEAAGFGDIEFVDSFEVEANAGYKAGRTVDTVPSDEQVTFSAVVMHAYKK